MMKYLKFSSRIFLTSMTALALLSPGAFAQNKSKSVAVTAIVEHPSLNAVRDGVYEVLQEAGYKEGTNLRWQYQSAQGNNSTAAQIARKFVGDKPDVIIAISTPSAQTVLASTKDIPVIFSAVTDPVAAKLTSTWDGSGTNVTGVSDMLELDKQIDLIFRVVPDAKVVGMVYNPAEANSVVVFKSLEEKLKARGVRLLGATAPRTVDVGTAARSLADKVDVFYTNTDNNVVAAYEAIGKVAQDTQTPLIASDPVLVKRGAAVALGVDYKELGRQTGHVALRIINGEKPGDIPVQTGEKIALYLSPSIAQKQGFTLPEDLIKEATEIIE